MPRQVRTVAETVDLKKLNEDWNSYPAPASRKRWAREYSTMTRHTQGKIDEDIIVARRPYEPKEIQKYRVKNFRAITKSAMNRAMNTLQRIMSKASVEVKWPEEADEFLQGNNFEDCDFLGYINKFVIRRMIEDANGLLIWWADLPGTRNVRVQPRPILLLSCNVLHQTEDLLLFRSTEKSPVSVVQAGKRVEVMEGEVFYIITKAGYYKRVQFGDKGKPRYRIDPGYAHQLGYLPILVLGGEEMMETDTATNIDEQWFASYFEPCTQFADEALHQFSDWQAVMVTTALPMREMEKIKCPNPDCNKGRVIELGRGGKETRVNCTVCRGTGKILPTGPYGFIERASKRSGFAEEPKSDPVPAIRFLHADPAILEQVEKAWRQLMLDVEKALHLLFIEEAQSGVAKEIDREDKVSTLDRIGANIYLVLVANSIEICLALMKITGEPEISMPATFLLRTDEDLRKEITELSGGGIIPLYQARATAQLIRQRFPADHRLHRITEALAYYDLYFGYLSEEKAALLAQGILSEDLVQRSAMAAGMLNRMAEEMDAQKFVEMPLKTIADALEKRIVAELAVHPVIPPPPPPPVLPGAGGAGGAGGGPKPPPNAGG